MMEKLKLQFEDQRLAAENVEIAAKSNCEVLGQELTDGIKDMEKSVAEKTEKKAEVSTARPAIVRSTFDVGVEKMMAFSMACFA